jgi:hypothetical protein
MQVIVQYTKADYASCHLPPDHVAKQKNNIKMVLFTILPHHVAAIYRKSLNESKCGIWGNYFQRLHIKIFGFQKWQSSQEFV